MRSEHTVGLFASAATVMQARERPVARKINQELRRRSKISNRRNKHRDFGREQEGVECGLGGAGDGRMSQGHAVVASNEPVSSPRE